MNYYEYIKNELIDNELTKKAKDYSKNKSDLIHYYNVGKLIIDAQGGEKRSKYGDGIINEYSKKLTSELGKNYSTTLLKNIRQYYLLKKKSPTLSDDLSWSHYVELITLKNIDEINYYISIIINDNLGVRDLRKRIKSREYERLDDKTKIKLINKGKIEVNDLVKNPIIIKNNLNINEISEKYLKKLILEDLDNFLKELGVGFLYVGSEYRIRIGDTFNYIDILLFNIKYNCYIVVELKVTELKKEHIGQIQIYMNYVDRNIKEIDHEKTIGIIVCRRDNKLVLEYSSDARIFSTTYVLVWWDKALAKLFRKCMTLFCIYGRY